jgi:hypothetical protein
MTYRFWTEEDDQILLELAYTDWTNEEIQANFFPERTVGSVQQRINKVLGISRTFNSAKNLKTRPYKYNKNNPVGNIDTSKPATLYIIKVDNIVKIGVTTIDIKARLRKSSIKNYSIIFQQYFENGAEALEKEQSWLQVLNPYQITEKLLPSGNREAFYLDKI